MDNTKYQYEGMKWLVEMELLNHPQVINTIRFNILMVSKHIKEVELLMYRENKTMLVLLDMSWIGRKFLKTGILAEVEDVLTQLLPSFRFRVTQDPKIMELAVAKVKKALTGGQNESSNNPSRNVSKSAEQTTSVDPATTTASEGNTGTAEGNYASQEKQPESIETVHSGSVTDNPEEK